MSNNALRATEALKIECRFAANKVRVVKTWGVPFGDSIFSVIAGFNRDPHPQTKPLWCCVYSLGTLMVVTLLSPPVCP